MNSHAIQRPEDLPPGRPGVFQPPAGLQARYRVRANRIVIEMPSNSHPGCLAVWSLLLVGLIGLLTYIFVDSKGNWIPVLFYGAVGGFVLAAMYGVAAPERTVVEVDPSRLRIVKRGLIFGSPRDIPAGQVCAAFLDATAITVLTPDGKVTLARELSPAEREWIHLILRRVLAC
jgi:hypothetical protein